MEVDISRLLLPNDFSLYEGEVVVRVYDTNIIELVIGEKLTGWRRDHEVISDYKSVGNDRYLYVEISKLKKLNKEEQARIKEYIGLRYK